MASGGCMKVIKYFLFLFNLLFFVLGAVILGFGIWILVDKTSFIAVLHSSSSSLKIGSYILIAVGGFTMIMGFLGCIGAVNEVRCLLGLYFTFLLLILLAQITAGVLIYLHRESLKTEMSGIVHELIVTYNPNDSTNTSTEDTWDYIQGTLQCCGWDSYQNWTENPFVNNQTNYYPCSCVKNANDTKGFCDSPSANLYPVGCMKQVEDWLQGNLGIILGVCVGVGVTELIGLVLSICLCRNIQNEDYTKVPKY
ncbi:CD82 antigen isoform X2 [Hyla sarda]|nr:CD82 antigen isoform X2 [Hyla sarda]XP_056383743.1 CD82 antigen isoform X2 [Hyla sarda]